MKNYKLNFHMILVVVDVKVSEELNHKAVIHMRRNF